MRAMLPRFFLSLVFITIAFTARAAEPISLTVHGDQITTVTLTGDDLAACPRSEVEAVEPHSGIKHVYSGIALRDLLLERGLPLGKALRGPAHQIVVRVTARDGYAAIFALAEFDSAFSQRLILLADQVDHQALPAKAAPLQLIVPGDTRAARWIRMVTKIEIISLAPPR